jgi:hypothetical protein
MDGLYALALHLRRGASASGRDREKDGSIGKSGGLGRGGVRVGVGVQQGTTGVAAGCVRGSPERRSGSATPAMAASSSWATSKTRDRDRSDSPERLGQRIDETSYAPGWGADVMTMLLARTLEERGPADETALSYRPASAPPIAMARSFARGRSEGSTQRQARTRDATRSSSPSSGAGVGIG